MKSVEKYFKPSVIALDPYSSARDDYEGSEGIFLDANENSYGNKYSRYPDPYQKELKSSISLWKNIDVGSIFLGNGSDEIIDILIRSTCESANDRILCLDPSYGLYKVSAGINQIPIDLVELNPDMTVNREQLISALQEYHKLVFICSPNNPNGGIIDPLIIEEILLKTNGLVVIDEAYIDFAETSSWTEKLSRYDNLIILQTFSKAIGAAGIRVGMAFMNDKLVSVLNKIKPPYNISSPNQEMALARISNIEGIAKSIQQIKNQRESLKLSLLKLNMVRFIFPSEANFLLVRFINAKYVFDQLIKMKIIVRNRSSLKHCDDCLRISVGTSLENRTLLNALSEIDRNLNEKI